MKATLRGRPRLDLDLSRILEAVRRHRQVMAAARELGCSDAYIHVRLKRVGLSLTRVLNLQTWRPWFMARLKAANPEKRTNECQQQLNWALSGRNFHSF